MEQADGQWRCQLCHTEFDASSDACPITAFETRSGETLRYVIRDNEIVVHVCVPSWIGSQHKK